MQIFLLYFRIFFIENGMMKKKLSNQNKSDYKRDC